MDFAQFISNAFIEDIGDGDHTTLSTIPEDAIGKAKRIVKQDGIIAGVDIAIQIFKQFDSKLQFDCYLADGVDVKEGDIAFEVSGSSRSIVTAERFVLNCMQRMSGIATMTSQCVAELAGYQTKILDTRKTVPGLRLLDKYAVLMGGGTNHRIGLYDMVLIKDNHIKIAGGITNAVMQIKKGVSGNLKIEVEVTNFDEVREALAAGADILMLDNMTTAEMAESVKIINNRAKVEASGNMTIQRLKEVAATGVDYISIGALTHSVTAFDISMNIES